MYNTGQPNRCPACGLVNFRDAQFCKRCGTQLRGAPFSAPPTGSQPETQGPSVHQPQTAEPPFDDQGFGHTFPNPSAYDQPPPQTPLNSPSTPADMPDGFRPPDNEFSGSAPSLPETQLEDRSDTPADSPVPNTSPSLSSPPPAATTQDNAEPPLYLRYGSQGIAENQGVGRAPYSQGPQANNPYGNTPGPGYSQAPGQPLMPGQPYPHYPAQPYAPGQPYPYPPGPTSMPGQPYPPHPGKPDAASYAAVPNPYPAGIQFPGYGYQQPYGYPQPPRVKTGMAVTSMILGIAGIFFCGLFLVGPMTGLVLGVVALVKANHHPDEYGGRGFAIAGLVTNGIGVLLFIPFLSTFLPAFNKGFQQEFRRARIEQNEAAAMNQMKSIGDAERSYRSAVGKGHYGTMEEIERAGLVNRRQLGTLGYDFFVVASGDRFAAFADPTSYASTGNRSFYLSSDDFKLRGADKSGDHASSDDPPILPEAVPRD